MGNELRFRLGNVNMAGLPQWTSDHSYNFHATFRLKMDHPVSHSDMVKALDKTLEILPVAKDSIIVHDNVLRFVKNPLPFVITKGEGIYAPGSRNVNGHTMSLDVEGDHVTASFMHSAMDGIGMWRFFITLLCQYCSIHFGKAYRCPDILLSSEGTDADMWTVPFDVGDDYIPPKITRKGIIVPEFSVSDDGIYRCSEFGISSNSFIRLAKKIGTSPSVLLFLFFAKTIYNMHPEENGSVTALLMMNARKAMNLPDTVLNCGIPGFLSVKRAAFANEGSIQEAAIKLRMQLKAQADPLYMKYMLESIRSEMGFDTSFTAILSYMRIDFGDCQKHVKDFRGYDPSTQKINLFDLGGHNMYISLLLGKATEEYTEAFRDVLGEAGIETEYKDEFSVSAEKGYADIWEPQEVTDRATENQC